MKENKPKSEGRSKESLIAFWIGKQIKPEIEANAVLESELTGIDINANALSKEIFSWAFPIYKHAGSLAALKKLKFSDLQAAPVTDLVRDKLKTEAKESARSTHQSKKKAG